VEFSHANFGSLMMMWNLHFQLTLLPFFLDLPIKKITQCHLKVQNLTILIDHGVPGREIRDQVPSLVGKNAIKSPLGI